MARKRKPKTPLVIGGGLGVSTVTGPSGPAGPRGTRPKPKPKIPTLAPVKKGPGANPVQEALGQMKGRTVPEASKFFNYVASRGFDKKTAGLLAITALKHWKQGMTSAELANLAVPFKKVPQSQGWGGSLKSLESIPYGLYQTGQAIKSDLAYAYSPSTVRAAFGFGSEKKKREVREWKPKTATLAAAIARQTKADIQHPLRNPVNTALDIWGLASLGAGGIAKAGMVGREVSAASKAAKAAEASRVSRVAKATTAGVKAIGERTPIGTRTLRLRELELHPVASRSALTRGIQRFYDALLTANPESRLMKRRIGKELAKTRRVTEAIERAPASALAYRGKRLSTPQETALRVVAEGKPISARIAFHEKELANATGRTARNIRKEIVILKAAERYVENVNGKPRIRAMYPELQETYKAGKTVAIGREAEARAAGLGYAMNPERAHMPGRVISGEDLATGEFRGGEYRVPYSATQPPRSHAAGPAQYKGGIPRKPPTVTHGYTGKLLKTGNYRNKTTRLVAESAIEMQRYGSARRLRADILKGASDEYHEGYVPVRTDALKNRPMPLRVKQLMEKQEEGTVLTKAEKADLGRFRDDYEKWLFPDVNELESFEGVKWVPKEVLARASTARPLAGLSQHMPARAVGKIITTINQAERSAILYLKPAYAVPNMLGNAAMNLVQQGFAAPRNLARSVRLNHMIGPEGTGLVDEMVGEGFARSLIGSGGVGQKAVQWMAGKWGAMVDVPFRRASFIHEAYTAGFNTPQKLLDLLTNQTHREKLVEVTRRAVAEIVDYGDLGPIERDIIRNVVFFYPWVKGSTKWAGHVVAEHPVQAAVVGELGQYGKKTNPLKDILHFEPGMFPIGSRGKNQMVVNPASIMPQQTPLDILDAITAFSKGDTSSARRLTSFLTPALSAGLATATRQKSFSGYDYPQQTSTLGVLGNELLGSLPQVLLAKRWRAAGGDQSSKLYPMSRLDAALQYGFGGAAPKPRNPVVAREMSEQIRRRTLTPVQRISEDSIKSRQFYKQVLKKFNAVPGGKLPAPLSEALSLRLRHEIALEKLTKKIGRGEVTNHDRLNTELDLLVGLGKIPKKVANQYRESIAHTPDYRLEALRTQFRNMFFGGTVISQYNSFLREQGIEVPRG